MILYTHVQGDNLSVGILALFAYVPYKQSHIGYIMQRCHVLLLF